MVLGSKSEERVKELLSEWLEDRRKILDDRMTSATTGIFIWGFLSGVVIAYTNLWPFLIGILFGYSISKREWPPIDRLYSLGERSMAVGYNLVVHRHHALEKQTEQE